MEPNGLGAGRWAGKQGKLANAGKTTNGSMPGDIESARKLEACRPMTATTFHRECETKNPGHNPFHCLPLPAHLQQAPPSQHRFLL